MYAEGGEGNANAMPIFNLFPRLEKVGRVLGQVVSFLPDTPLSRGDHFAIAGTGASEMLDESLELRTQANQIVN